MLGVPCFVLRCTLSTNKIKLCFSDPQCVSSANHSADWLLNNFGFFSRFASITDFYRLNPKFSGVNLERPLKSEWIQNLNNKFSLFCIGIYIHFFSPLCCVQLEVLHLLSPNQTAELLLLDLPTPPEKDEVIDRVFDFLLESPEDRRFSEVLSSLVRFAGKVTAFETETPYSIWVWPQ